MKAYDFTYGPKLISGPGATGRLGALLPPGRCLFVTDAQVRSLGLADAAINLLLAAGLEPIIFDAVEPDPSRATLEAAVAAGEGCASVVGLGGGSPMDVAKLAAYLIGSGDDLDSLWGVGKALGGRLRLALVPTTAGTGSEATPVTVITLGGAEKRGVSSAALVADWAILDARLTLGLPRTVTAATGIDAMVHAIEAYTSAHRKNPLSDMLAREALRLLADNLPRVCASPGDLEARGAMLLGAHLAGVAFANAPVAGVHALAYPLGGHFHVPHGLSNALMLRHVLGHNMIAAMTSYAELAMVLDPGLAAVGTQAQAQGLVEHLSRLSIEAGVPQRLSEVEVTADHLDLLAREAMKQERLLINNPCPITEADARRLYAAAPVSRPALKPRAHYRAWRTIGTRWADNDVYGHVNNIVYHGWFDTAVNAWLIEAGLLDIEAGDPIGLVVETGCIYARPLAFPQKVEVGLIVNRVGKSSVVYGLGVFSENMDEAAAEGQFIHVYVDRLTRRPVALPAAWREILETIASD